MRVVSDLRAIPARRIVPRRLPVDALRKQLLSVLWVRLVVPDVQRIQLLRLPLVPVQNSAPRQRRVCVREWLSGHL